MSQQPATTTPAAPAPDPFALWRDWLSQSERQWNQFLNQAMATDEFSQAMGRMMDITLGMQKSLNDVMGRYFSALNLPTRTDVLSVAGKVAEIEERLEAIERKLDQFGPAKASRLPGPAPVAKPPRTRKPPGKP